MRATGSELVHQQRHPLGDLQVPGVKGDLEAVERRDIDQDRRRQIRRQRPDLDGVLQVEQGAAKLLHGQRLADVAWIGTSTVISSVMRTTKKSACSGAAGDGMLVDGVEQDRSGAGAGDLEVQQGIAADVAAQDRRTRARRAGWPPTDGRGRRRRPAACRHAAAPETFLPRISRCSATSSGRVLTVVWTSRWAKFGGPRRLHGQLRDPARAALHRSTAPRCTILDPWRPPS